MDLSDSERLAAIEAYEVHVRELELWLAMLITELGERTEAGYRLRLDPQRALAMRNRLSSRTPVVIITAAGGVDGGHFVDVL